MLRVVHGDLSQYYLSKRARKPAQGCAGIHRDETRERSEKNGATSERRTSLFANTDKLRRCLKCQASFLSAWEGHRICDRCKHTSAWREGMPGHIHCSMETIGLPAVVCCLQDQPDALQRQSSHCDRGRP
jgi:hypothetical protein